MAEIFGNTTTTPINPDLFGGGSGATSVASAILNTIEGGTDSITVNDVSPLAHSCSCRLESDNIYDFNSKYNMAKLVLLAQIKKSQYVNGCLQSKAKSFIIENETYVAVGE